MCAKLAAWRLFPFCKLILVLTFRDIQFFLYIYIFIFHLLSHGIYCLNTPKMPVLKSSLFLSLSLSWHPFPTSHPQNRVVFPLRVTKNSRRASAPAERERERLFIWLCQVGKEWHRISVQRPTKTDGRVWQPRQANNCNRNLICPLFSILSLKNTIRINLKLMENMPKCVLLWKCLFRAICLCLAFLLQCIFLHTLWETTLSASI